MTEETKSSAKPLLIGTGVAVVIGAIIFLQTRPPAPEPQVAAQSEIVLPAVVAPEPVVEEIAEAEAEAEAEVEAAPAAPTEDTTAPEVAADTPELPQGPTFDTFRVEPDGSMVIAGRADPGQVVDIMLSGVALERVTADASGAFVALPFAGPSDQPRRLSLLADPEGAALASETSYIVAPIAAPVVMAEIAPEPAPVAEAVEETAVAALEAAPEGVEPAPVVNTAPAPRPTVLQADADGVRVVQGGPSITAPEVDPNVALDAITYDPQGEVQLSGRAIGDGAVQVYIDNKPLTASPVTEGGDWQIDLPEIDTGIYTLRIDEVDQGGAVVSRLETPFKREEAADVAAVLAEETGQDGFEVAVKTVQPGATLWAIAEENFGSGIFYVEVFEANADLIRDPDLIYPGQIFRMPEISQ